MLLAPPPGPACTDVPLPPGKVVLPETEPPPAVTELPIAPEPAGACSPGFKWTVRQLSLGYDDDVALPRPSDDDELAELLLLALCACAATDRTSAAAPAQINELFMVLTPSR